MTKDYGKTIGARLGSDQISSLNAYMIKNGFANLGELIHSVLNDRLMPRPTMQLGEIVNKREQTVYKLDNMRARWDSNPRPTA